MRHILSVQRSVPKPVIITVPNKKARQRWMQAGSLSADELIAAN
jgi:hypothetical protein